MKKSSIIGIVFVLLVGIFLGGWLTRKFIPFPDGMVLVPQTTVDSLNAYMVIADSLESIANLPPDTIVEIIIRKDSIVYVETEPTFQPDPVNSSVSEYESSLQVDGEVHAWVKFKVNGFVEGNLHWGYETLVKEIKTTIEKKIPYPVITTRNVPVPSIGNYLSLKCLSLG